MGIAFKTNLLLVTLLLLGCSGPSEEATPDASARHTGSVPDARAIEANNLGVGLMGQFKYAEAAEVFAGLVEARPEWADAQVNLAIATLNRQQEGDEQAALNRVEALLQKEPGDLRAHYVAGLLRLYLVSPAEAVVHFRQVVEQDPDDAYAAYYLAQCLAQQNDHIKALSWYRRSMRSDPYLRSAYYGTFQALQRLKRRDEAKELMKDYQRLSANPRSRLAEFKYTRMGPKAEALAVNMAAPEPSPLPAGSAFLDGQRIALDSMPLRATHIAERAAPISITVADMQNDGLLDIFVAGAGNADASPNLLLQGHADGTYAALPDHPLARVAQVNSALWGDYDNDGQLDVYLCRKGTNQLWRQFPQGQWTDVTQSTGTAGEAINTVDGAFFDADHDGDLDLFLVNTDGPNELLNNNLNGSFRALAKTQGIAGTGRASRQVIPTDIDRDRDLDIIVLNETPPHEVYLNDRLWNYHPATGFDAFRASPAKTGLAADLNADGFTEIYTLDDQARLLRWHRGADARFLSQPVKSTVETGAAWHLLSLVDAEGDGHLDLITAGPTGWSVAGKKEIFKAELPAGQNLLGLTHLVRDSSRGPTMIGMLADGGLMVWAPGLGRHPYLAVTLSGKEDQAQSMRSNVSGIGAHLALRVGSRWTLSDSLFQDGGPGQSLQPLAFGLGGAKKADYLAIDWSDGVFQTELALPVGKTTTVAETQRQLSSCPVLFAWNGENYQFITDLLGVGGIGYAVGPGEYATPRPWENLLLPAGLLQPKQDRYQMKLTEPMEEAAYLDSVRLVGYDLPPGWQMVLDERMGIAGPEPTGAPRYFRHEYLPIDARNERGTAVTTAITKADGRAAPPGELDRRFIGRLASEHIITLTFAQALDQPPGKPMLVMDGWVEYPYSQTSFAAWQAGVGFDAPTLEAKGEDGRWYGVLEHFGYPAGMSRRMSVPLDGVPSGTTQLRLRTNQEIYWDRIAVAYVETPPQTRRHYFPLRHARVAKTGFPRRSKQPQHRADYDYTLRTTFWDARYMAGYYTTLGAEVRALVAETDDALAIFGAGEEIHLAFAASAPLLSEGRTRRFVLETQGWTKDMDLFTRNGETLGPLPNKGLDKERAARLHARYNQRYQDGH